MDKHFIILFFCLIMGGLASAQTPQSPSFHGGDLSKILDFRNPVNNTILKNPEHDFSRQNPRFRSLMPKERKCVTVEMEGDLRTQYAKETESDSTFEDWIDDAIKRTQATRSTRRAARLVYTLPVVVHIIYSNTTENISNEQIQSQIEVLNADYRRQNSDRENTPREFRRIASDTEIEFCMASVDPDGNPTDGIDRISISGSPFSERFINEEIKPNTIWNPDQYLNIWVCNISGGILGFAQFPTSAALTGLPISSGSAQTDGVVINYNTFGTMGTVTTPFDKGRTVTHEVGHWLGLRHIWGDGPCGVDDFCDDTPETSGANFSCPPGTIGCDGVSNVMIQNFMDYTDDACMNLFTLDQKQRMRAVLENSPRRTSLLNSTVCTPPAEPPKPAFITDITTGCGPLTVNFTDQSEGENIEYEWLLNGAKPSRSKKSDVKAVYKKPGTYSVSLRVTNSGGSRSLEKSQIINVVDKGKMLPITATFEPDAAFPPEGFIVHNPDRDTTWNQTEKLGAKGLSNGSLYIDNYENNLKDGSDWLLTPIMDFSKDKGTKLGFNLAYTNFNSSYSDTLGIFIATGCDPFFRCIYFKGGKDLATMPELQRPYLPRESEWRTEMIDLRKYDGEEFVQIAFVNFSGYGNTLFIDDIEISATPKPAPIARFSASSASICAGSTVSFKDNSSDKPTRWVWAFPGGVPASDTSQNPQVTYETPGIYDVVLTASNQTGDNTVTMKGFVEVKPNAPLKLSASKTEICEGEEITLTGSGLPEFTWDLGGTEVFPQGKTVTITPKQDITYSIRGEGESGCEAVASVTIRVKPGRVLSINPPSARVCRGGEPVELNATGGRNYSWSPAIGLSNTNSAFVKAAPTTTTTYTLTGISDNGCELKQEITVEVDQGPENIDISSDQKAICPGEAATLTAAGGEIYRWFPVSSLNLSEGNEVIATPRQTTTYRIQASSENGCFSEKEFTLEVAPKPRISVSAGFLKVCEGQPVLLSASGALAYLWTPGNSLLDAESGTVEARPTQTTRYTVMGSNEFGCLDTNSIDIQVVKAPPLTVTASKSSICFGERSILAASGAIQYQWDPAPGIIRTRGGEVMVSPQADQVYKVRGKDARGCVVNGEVKVSVSQGARPFANFKVDQTDICARQTVQFSSLSENAVDFQWEFPGGTPSKSTEANPKVTYQEEGIFDVFLSVKGCGSSTARKEEEGLIAVMAPVRISLNTESSVTLCKDETMTLMARGAERYEWSPATGLDHANRARVTATAQVNTTYTVIGFNGDGCQASKTVDINVVGEGNNLKITPFSPVICQGEKVLLRASGAASYRWSPAKGLNTTTGIRVTASPTETTTYVVEGTDLDGCVFTDTVVVNVREKQNISITSANKSLCVGEKTTLRVNGQGVYEWSPTFGLNTTTGRIVEAFPNETTTYTAIGTDENGCESSARIKLFVNSNRQVTASAQDEEVCAGEATLLTARGGANYSWSPKEGLDQTSGPIVTASPTKTTTYQVTSGDGGCGQSYSVTIEVKKPAVLKILPENPRVCKGGAVDLEVNGGKVYVWDAAEGLSSVAGSNVTVFPTNTTSYGVSSIDSMGCETRGSVTVQVGNVDFLSATASVGSVCREGQVNLGASGAEKYSWLPGDGIIAQDQSATVARPNSSATYRVVGEDQYGCVDTAEVRVEVNPVAGEFEMSKTEIDLANGVGLVRFKDKTEGAIAWIWDFGQGSTSKLQNPVHVYTEVGTYKVGLKVSNGVCGDLIEQEIVVKNTSSLEEISQSGEIQITEKSNDGLVDLEMKSPRDMYLRLTLLDGDGMQLLSGALRIRSGLYQQTLDLKGYDKGMYEIQLTDGTDIFKRQIEYN